MSTAYPYRVPEHVFRHLLRAIRSLTDSTDVTIFYRGFAAIVDGRCSQYVTHRGVTYEYSLPTSYIAVRNRKYAITFTMEQDMPAPDLRAHDLSPLRHEWHYIIVPSLLLKPIADMFVRYFGETPFGKGVIEAWVAMPILSHYREDGRPVYVPADDPIAASDSSAGAPITPPLTPAGE